MALAPLDIGASVGRGWHVADLAGPRGATILSLAHRDGREARVHICARSGRARGLAHTALFDLVLMDGGQGDRPTEERLGRVLQQLARHIRRNELRVDDDGLRSVVQLQSHTDRALATVRRRSSERIWGMLASFCMRVFPPFRVRYKAPAR